MIRNATMSAALVATSVGLLAAAAPAMAQLRDAVIRFESAQRRFDGELAIFKAEVERYERARTAAPAPAPLTPRAEEPRRLSDDAVGNLDEPAANAPLPAPADRGEGENRSPQ